MSILTLDDFQGQAAQEPSLSVYAAQLRMLHDLIDLKCRDSVVWAAAFGSFLRSSPSIRRTLGRRLEVLVVTTNASSFKAHMLLAEKVFGPTLEEFGSLPDYNVWTLAEFQDVVGRKDELLRRVLTKCVTVFGAPLVTSAVA